MNRLTRTAEVFDYCRDFCGDCKYPAEIHEKCLDARLYERLRDYEDTNLTPDEVRAKSAWADKTCKLLDDLFDGSGVFDFAHIKELLTAEAEAARKEGTT